MFAIVSDIHANLEAFQAVLGAIRAAGISRVVCLGDVIGYGPNPRECLDIAMKFEFTIMGNHDQAVLYEPMNFNIGAERASFWTRKQLEEEPDDAKRNARWDFLGSMLPRKREGDLLLDGTSSAARRILLSPGGREITSEELAQFLQKELETYFHIAFLLGGPLGFAPEVEETADTQISLSRLTFPHELARIVFLEQLYRAFTILRGEKYHK